MRWSLTEASGALGQQELAALVPPVQVVAAAEERLE